MTSKMNAIVNGKNIQMFENKKEKLKVIGPKMKYSFAEFIKGGFTTVAVVLAIFFSPQKTEAQGNISNPALEKMRIVGRFNNCISKQGVSPHRTLYGRELAEHGTSTADSARVTLGFANGLQQASQTKLVGNATEQYRKYAAELYLKAANMLERMEREQAIRVIESVQQNIGGDINTAKNMMKSFNGIYSTREETSKLKILQGLLYTGNRDLKQFSYNLATARPEIKLSALALSLFNN